MAQPRRIVPGDIYMLTRRCSGRRFRLKPCAQTNQIFLYCLALASSKTGVVVHAVCVMSNHHHLVVSDPKGLLPDFLRELHRFTAKAMNSLQGERENLWAAEPCNVVRLATDIDVAEKIAYVAANPVAAGLVERPEDWPGVNLWGSRKVFVAKPDAYFRKDGACPPVLKLMVTEPPPRDVDVEHRGERRRRVPDAVMRRVEAAHRGARVARRRFLGPEAVLSASFRKRARSRERIRGIVPTFAAKLRFVRERQRRVERDFRARYCRALQQWRAGRRDVPFPFGTWGMRVFHSAAIEPPPPSWSV